MGVYNRDYMRDDSGGGGIPSPRSWSPVTWLVVLNAFYYLIDVLVFDNAHFGMVSREALFQGHIYLLVTYMFVHGSILHLAFNMILLFFAGKGLLQLIGKRNFLMVYFGGGILGAVVQLAFFPNNLLGASAGAIAILIALASILPKQEVYLMIMFILPVRMKLRTIAILVVGIDLVRLIGATTLGWTSDIGHLAHLGGAFFGWAFVIWMLPRFQSREQGYQQQERWQNRFGTRQVVDAEVIEDRRTRRARKKREKEKKEQAFVSEDVDAILDKISEHGMQSLTPKERKLLEKSSEKLSRRVDRR